MGDVFAIRRFARRRQKNDRRDAELLLELLLRGDFPAVRVPGPASRDVLSLLRYRHRLARIRTMLKNGRHAVALSHQLRLGPRLFSGGAGAALFLTKAFWSLLICSRPRPWEIPSSSLPAGGIRKSSVWCPPPAPAGMRRQRR